MTIIYPDGRRVLDKGGFLWFKTVKVPPMSVIEVPRRYVIEKPSRHVPSQKSRPAEEAGTGSSEES